MWSVYDIKIPLRNPLPNRAYAKVSYRKVGDADIPGNYTVATHGAVVSRDGSLQGLVIRGLAEGKDYALKIEIRKCPPFFLNVKGPAVTTVPPTTVPPTTVPPTTVPVTTVPPTTVPATTTAPPTTTTTTEPVKMWVADSYVCEDDKMVFEKVKEIPNLSSPYVVHYDQISGRMYVVDADDVNGNFYWFDPNTINVASDVHYIPGLVDKVYGFAMDKENRRIFAVGLNTGGAKVLDIATDTVSTMPYGTDGDDFSRFSIQVLSDRIIALDGHDQRIHLFDRTTLAQVSQTDIASIPSGSAYFGRPFQTIQVGSEIWVLASQRANGNIGVYNSTLDTILGEVTLDGVATIAGWGNNLCWQSSFFDQEKNRLYVNDFGSSKVFVVNTLTKAVLEVKDFRNREGKFVTLVAMFLDPITQEMLWSAEYFSVPGESDVIRRMYKVDRDTQKIELIHVDQGFRTISHQVGTPYLWGSSNGATEWENSPSWNSDGKIIKYTH